MSRATVFNPSTVPCDLNASVQGLEDNTRRYRKSPLMVDAFPVCLPEVLALPGPWTTCFANFLNDMVHDGVDLDVDIRDRILTGSECPRGQGPRADCEEHTFSQATALQVSDFGQCVVSVLSAGRVWDRPPEDVKRTVSVSKRNIHRDHGLPPVAVVGVFVPFPPPHLSVVPPGLVPVPGLFGVPLLCLSLLSCNGGCTNAISHLRADSECCSRGRSLQEERVESGHRPKCRYLLSFFDTITKGRRPKNRALPCQGRPLSLFKLTLGPSCLLPCSPSSRDLCACPLLTLTFLFRQLHIFDLS